jgi:hypothetical protein
MDHVHDHHGHDHGHGHGHDHHGHSAGEYYLEQLLTIFVSGGFGIVAILMYQQNRLDKLLAPEFHLWTLLGGIALLAIALVRAAGLWVESGKLGHANTHDHNHEHGHDHARHEHGPECQHDHGPGHDHSHHSHGHTHGDDHGHDHASGVIFLKILGLCVPIVLFFLGLPNAGFSQEWIERRLGTAVDLGDVKDVEAKVGGVQTLDFAEMNLAAHDESKRAAYQGQTVRVKGQLQKVKDREYRLFKLKINCCAADTIPLEARILTNFVTQFNNYDWVTVEGVMQFVGVEDRGRTRYIPVIRVTKVDGIQKAQPE